MSGAASFWRALFSNLLGVIAVSATYHHLPQMAHTLLLLVDRALR